MLKKDKIRLMSDLAIYEKRNESDVFKINKYYKSDYIFWQLLMAFIRYTFCAMIITALYVFFRADEFFYNVNLSGINQILKELMTHYVVGLVIYLLITTAVYSYRYKKARKGMLFYATKLKRLARKYHYTDSNRSET